MNAERLILGTVQLGLPYGVANTAGKPGPDQALDLVRAAWQGGVRWFDTAQAYGDSETVLGSCLRALGATDKARVVGKLAPSLDLADPETVLDSVRSSLERLGLPRLAGLLLHDEALLDQWDQGVAESLTAVRETGLAELLGVSVYTPAAALRALKTDGLDLVQLPCNALDRRFEQAGVFDLARETGKTLHLRSVFLQGLLLMDPAGLPAGLEQARPHLESFRTLAANLDLSPAALALGFVRDAHPEAMVLFGAETRAQVEDNLCLWSTPLPGQALDRVRQTFSDLPEAILNPSLWKVNHAA